MLHMKQSPFLPKHSGFNSPNDRLNNINSILHKTTMFKNSLLRSPNLQMRKDAELELLKSTIESKRNISSCFCILKMETFDGKKKNNKEMHLFRTQVKKGMDPEFNETFEIEFTANEGKAFTEDMLKNKLGTLAIGIYGDDYTPGRDPKQRGFLAHCKADMKHLAALSGETISLEIDKPILYLSIHAYIYSNLKINVGHI